MNDIVKRGLWDRVSVPGNNVLELGSDGHSSVNAVNVTNGKFYVMRILPQFKEVVTCGSFEIHIDI